MDGLPRVLEGREVGMDAKCYVQFMLKKLLRGTVFKTHQEVIDAAVNLNTLVPSSGRNFNISQRVT